MRFSPPSIFWRLALLHLAVPCVFVLGLYFYFQDAQTKNTVPQDARYAGPDEWWVIRQDLTVVDSNSKNPIPVERHELEDVPPRGSAFKRPGMVDYDRVYIVPEGNGKYLVARRHFDGKFAWDNLLLPFVWFIANSVLIGMMITFGFLRRDGKKADEVLKRLRSGDLKARFPRESLGKFGSLVDRFNDMAADIEKLVIALRVSETKRAQTLRELAHDVRTPLGTMQLVVEGLLQKRKPNTEAAKKKKLEVLDKELGFLRELIDSLLTIAQLEDPAFSEKRVAIEPIKILKHEIAIYRGRDTSWPRWVITGKWEPFTLWGDPEIFSRVIRNVLENAVRHTKKQISVEVAEAGPGRVRIIIRNDGIKFTEEAIATYGQKRAVRLVKVEARHGSVGLGSVIVKTAVEKLGGIVRVGNWVRSRESGAEVVIELPAEPAINSERLSKAA